MIIHAMVCYHMIKYGLEGEWVKKLGLEGERVKKLSLEVSFGVSVLSEFA